MHIHIVVNTVSFVTGKSRMREQVISNGSSSTATDAAHA